MNTRKIVLLALLISITIILSIVESFIPSIGIPGIKLGIANIMIIVILYELSFLDALLTSLIRVLITAMARGTFMSMGFFMSISGALFSLLIMTLFIKIFKKFSILSTSTIGSVAHIIAQFLVAIIYLDTIYVLYYLPIILLSSIISGVIIGLIAKAIIKTGIIKRQKEKYKF